MIDPNRYGVSFSLKQCRNFQLDPVETLDWLIDQGWRRFRLMSYWNEHEKHSGEYDFTALDRQIQQVAAVDGVVSLCLGVRQPRWPENHWPDWAWNLSPAERTKALLTFITAVVEKYKHQTVVISYQLENEALLKSFGLRPDVNRSRLRQEFKLVKTLDPSRPVIMTTSTSWGIPLRQPIPDIVGFSYYHIYYSGKDQRYHKAGGHYVLLHRLRALLIRLIWHRPSFIHELQCEPWGPHDIWEISLEERAKSMDARKIRDSFQKATATRLHPVDVWGAEWWYWSYQQGDKTVWKTVQDNLDDRNA